MAKLTPCVGSLLSLLGVLVLVGVVGAPNIARAQSGDAGVLHACVHRDLHDGEVHGYIRIVLPHEPCRWFEARFRLNVGGPGGGSEELGTIHGQVLSCLLPLPGGLFGSAAGSFAAVAGQSSLVVFTNGTGAFELSRVPPGTHELVLGVPGISEVAIVSGVEVRAGNTTEVDPTVVCFPE